MSLIAVIASFALAAYGGVACRSTNGTLAVSRVGAQTTSWRPAALRGEDAFFMAASTPWGREVHGGIPVCWPWFGRREGLPIHGLVRYMEWRLVRRLGNDGVELTTESTAESMKLWPHKFRLTARIAMVDPSTMEIALSETNTGDEPFESAFGIHPYFAVSNALSVAVDGRALPRPNGDTAKFPADGKAHLLCDLERGRGYAVDAPYADSWWIWNPGEESTPCMKTLVSDDWRKFWCLEALMCEPRPLAPGETRVYTVEISISYEFMKEGVEV
ncbi:MAG: hypothetical protein IKK82_15480 [Kiritimatiellae bacterium]|nr:hypothetical protein [Kiritimatiellia bacterium]